MDTMKKTQLRVILSVDEDFAKRRRDGKTGRVIFPPVGSKPNPALEEGRPAIVPGRVGAEAGEGTPGQGRTGRRPRYGYAGTQVGACIEKCIVSG